jgi:hypothetical protein
MASAHVEYVPGTVDTAIQRHDEGSCGLRGLGLTRSNHSEIGSSSLGNRRTQVSGIRNQLVDEAMAAVTPFLATYRDLDSRI